MPLNMKKTNEEEGERSRINKGIQLMLLDSTRRDALLKQFKETQTKHC